MQPHGPAEHLFAKPSTGYQNPGTYVADLQEQLKTIHQAIATKLHGDFEKRLKHAHEQGERHAELNVGDSVFLKHGPKTLADRQDPSSGKHLGDGEGGRPAGASARLSPYCDPRPYKIYKISGPMIYLEDSFGSRDLGFSQPVHSSRCVPFSVANLEHPITEERPLRLAMRQRDGKSLEATVSAQTSAGLVRLSFEERADLNGLYDLAQEEYWWLP